jgi:hypothetical protein
MDCSERNGVAERSSPEHWRSSWSSLHPHSPPSASWWEVPWVVSAGAARSQAIATGGKRPADGPALALLWERLSIEFGSRHSASAVRAVTLAFAPVGRLARRGNDRVGRKLHYLTTECKILTEQMENTCFACNSFTWSSACDPSEECRPATAPHRSPARSSANCGMPPGHQRRNVGVGQFLRAAR